MKKILVLALTLTACGNKAQNLGSIGSAEFDQSGIISGVEVKPSDLESKSTVGIYLRQGDKVSTFCTGTLIAPQIVLTAAHCFADFAAEANTTVEQVRRLTLIGFGIKSAKTMSDPQVVFMTADKITIHPDYRVNSVATAKIEPMKDIALVRISRVAPAGFSPAALPTSEVPQTGHLVSVAGYGLTKVGLLSSQEARQLMKVTLPVGDANFSETQFSDRVIQGKSSCMGDSGGPVYMRSSTPGRLVVVGIVSWGDGACSQIGVYTKTVKFRSWIQEAVKALTR